MSHRAIPEISPEDLASRIERGVAHQVLDIRAPHRLSAGTIDLTSPGRFINLPGSKLLALGDPRAAGLDPATPVTVVCGHGNSSKQITSWLNTHGFQAESLRGGMAAWMHVVAERELPPPAGFDAFVQLDRIGKGALGYVLVAGGDALVVDPPRRWQQYTAVVDRLDARVVAVADTHVHADYISGAATMANTLGVPYYLHAADAVYPYDGRVGKVRYTPIEDGAAIALGGQRVRVMHTPGHTEGSVSYLAGDAALTGDFIFLQSIGRPDLAGKTAEWTARLWASLERARREWPRDIRICPAHYAAEAERNPDRSVAAPFNTLPARNEALRIEDAAVFTRWIADRTREAPAAYREIKAVNVGLKSVSDPEADDLEGGKNECAIG